MFLSRDPEVEPPRAGLDLHPVLRTWFERRFGTPTAAQAAAWPPIQAGKNVLIAAPTGSGKTLAAFLVCIDRLIRAALAGLPIAGTRVVYVSPLKALSNDIHRTLIEPLGELGKLAAEMGTPLPPIRAAVRTGDTSAAERRLAARQPPHILVTTPESLYILLTSESGRRGLATVDTLILDEIHALCADKRGAHLALSAERLEHLLRGRALQRIGLSATVRPLSVAARLLTGARLLPEIIDATQTRELDLHIELPSNELGAVTTLEQWEDVYGRIATLVNQHRSTLVFVNTRRLVERVAHNLAARVGATAVGAHHGSLSRERRFSTEQRLKAGNLKVVVATASLELGIDVGAVELVCLVGSPRTIATGLQRIGRASHHVGGTPKGRLFPLTRDQLVECAALVRAARAGELDRVALRNAPLDILAQQLVAACACEDWHEDALYTLVRRAGPYAELSRASFDAILDLLVEGVTTARGRTGALLHRDGVGRIVRARRGTRLLALTNGGAIPDVALYDVVEAPADVFIGTLDEDFAIESMAGDIFLLGNTSWRILRVENGRVRVENALGLPPTVPFWFGEGPARSLELSAAVGELRTEIARRLSRSIDDPRACDTSLHGWLQAECALDDAGAEVLCRYIAAGRAALGAVPAQDCVIAERFFDESGGTQIVLHAPFGGRINRAWGTALRKRFCQSFDFELQAAATDEGILLSLGPQHSFPLEMVFDMLTPEAVPELLSQAALQSPLFETRWRWNASRALLLRRHTGGKRVPPHLQRMRVHDLLAACFPAQVACQDNHGGPIEIPDHPLVQETVRDCLSEAMDIDGLIRVLAALRAGHIRRVVRETPEPSVLAHEILNANPYAFLDDAPLEERRARAVAVRRGLPTELATDLGRLDPAAVAEVSAAARPTVRDPEELHDFLLDVGVFPEIEGQALGFVRHFEPLLAHSRATRLAPVPTTQSCSPIVHWVAAERLELARLVWPHATLTPVITAPPVRGSSRCRDRGSALVEIVRGHMTFSPPTTAQALGARLGLTSAEIETALLAVEAEGQILRGSFGIEKRQASQSDQRLATSGPIEWFDRRLLARANRLTVEGLRRQIVPASPAELLRFLFHWQHVAPGTQLHGRDGVLETIRQLQGFEAAAGAWESEILAARVNNYDSSWLDDLCLSGEVAWGRLAPREDNLRAPSRAAPIAIFLRRALPWLLAPEPPGASTTPPGTTAGAPPATLSDKAKDVWTFLERAGASFLEDIVAGTNRLRSEVEDGLWELVAAGWVTADGFAPLRALLAPSSRRANRWRWYTSPRRASSRFVGGRWSPLRPTHPAHAPVPDDRVLHLARQYVRRYGIVFRELLAREPHAPPWRELVRSYRNLEMRGELRGGRMVAGFAGEQFALPEAVDALRAMRNRPPDGQQITISACDPLNMAGILTPPPRVSAQLGKQVLFIDGVPKDMTETRRPTRYATRV